VPAAELEPVFLNSTTLRGPSPSSVVSRFFKQELRAKTATVANTILNKYFIFIFTFFSRYDYGIAQKIKELNGLIPLGVLALALISPEGYAILAGNLSALVDKDWVEAKV
jgi:hypothetical protein